MLKSLKIKPLTKEQIIISLDRLTRFKPTSQKYLRVFTEIISSNLIYPVYKKDELKLTDKKLLTEYINKIFDYSRIQLGLKAYEDYSINKKIEKYEKSIFKFDTEIEELLKNKIDYKAFATLLKDSSALNIKWLLHLINGDANIRERFATRIPVKKVVLVEGITEEILLPVFAKKFGHDFDKEGIAIISAGGKNQSVKIFYSLVETLKLPIFVLFDKDAFENCKEIEPKLREFDKIHVLQCGEFEDLLSLNHIKRTINKMFKNYCKISISQLREQLPMTKVLDKIFRECGSEFKKAEFASLLSADVQETDLTDRIKITLSEIIR